jgi:hypothetical protein
LQSKNKGQQNRLVVMPWKLKIKMKKYYLLLVLTFSLISSNRAQINDVLFQNNTNQESTTEMNQDSGTDYEIYQNNEFGIPQKTGEVRQNFNGDYDVYENNEFGIPQKTGEIRRNNQGGHDYYQNNQFGIPQKTEETKQNYDGSLDVYENNQFGIPQKTGEIKEKNSQWVF